MPASTARLAHRGPVGDREHLRHRRATRTSSACGRACRATGPQQTMWMRFRASYYDRATEQWYDVPGDSSVSPWIKVGNARYRARQAGRRFHIDPPLPTTSHVVRGVVDFRWRRKNGKVVRRTTRKTLSRPPDGPPRRPARLLGRALRDHVPVASRSKRRGSFVITPCTPIASSRAIFFGVVHGPHVELAAGRADAAARAAASRRSGAPSRPGCGPARMKLAARAGRRRLITWRIPYAGTAHMLRV